MKLIVDKVEYGYAPTGPGYGTKVFHFGFKEVEGDYELKDVIDEKGEVIAEATDEEKISNELIENIQQKILEEKLEKEFSNALLNNFIYFSGDELIKDEKNTEILSNILKVLEGTSIEFQKNVLMRKDPNVDLTKAKFKALKTVFTCEPKYFTGNRKAYQIFQIVLCKLPLKEKPYNPMAIVEIEGYNNVFHILELTDNFENELGYLKSEYLDQNVISIPTLKTFVNIKTDKNEVYDKLDDYDYIITRNIPSKTISI